MTKSFTQNSAGLYVAQKPLSKKQILKFAYELLVPEFLNNELANSPHKCSEFLKIALASESQECFGVVFLTTQLQIIRFEILSKGTLREAQIPPRKIVKRVIELNASSVIFAHNHPSAIVDPSQADKDITEALSGVLSAIDVEVIDHIIVGGNNHYSFAEHGLINR